MKRIAVILGMTLTLCLSAVLSSFAASNFIIKDYDIKMVVNEDDTYLITETVDVKFTAPSHGIYRAIPRWTRLDRDGQVSEYAAEVRDFRMLSGQPVTQEKDTNNFLYRIGDPGSYADTETTYKFSYIYDTGGDHFKGGDEVYHNMVGTTWEARSIDHVSFEVVFPEDIDAEMVGIKTGDQTDVPFETPDARTIKGETDANVLGGLTIRAVLPEGYFTREVTDPVWIFWGVVGLLAVMAAAGIVLWRRYGIDPVYPVTTEFYPPDGLSAPETAYLSSETISNHDVISILLTLADKGYVRINETAVETGKRHNTEVKYSIDRLRGYDGDDPYERMFMDGLFEDGDSVQVADLKEKFYKTAESIADAIKMKYSPLRYDREAESKASILYIAGGLGLIILSVAAKLTSGNDFGQGFLTQMTWLLPPVACMIASFAGAGGAVRSKDGPLSYLFPVVFAGMGFYLYVKPGTVVSWQLLPFCIGLALCLLLFVIGGLCEKKTEYFAQIQAKIKGYKDFLKTAEKDQMEMLAEKDPGYYYRNLAYAFALGVTAVYAKRFAAMAEKAPAWYHSDTGSFSTRGVSGMADSISRMTSSVSSTLSSDGKGGGSFSGGGGGGGGGGGSW